MEDNLDEFLFSEVDNNICFQVETPPNEPNDAENEEVGLSDYKNNAPVASGTVPIRRCPSRNKRQV